MSSRQNISIIIPIRDEQATLGRTLERLESVDGVGDIIVADGHSKDDSIAIAHAHRATVVTAPGGSIPCRGVQLNAGAKAATGDVLLFLHADTLLPVDFAAHVFQILNRPETIAGAFRLTIDAPNRSLRMIERFVNMRSRLLQLPYGDQAIFLRRQTFQHMGGYPEWPVMEDYALIRRLRREGRVGLADANATTSARFWLKRGVWRATMLNQICIAAYRLGVSPQRIARWRTDRSKDKPTSQTMRPETESG